MGANNTHDKKKKLRSVLPEEESSLGPGHDLSR